MSKGVRGFLQKNKHLLVTHLIAVGILLLGFVLCRCALFGLHGMKEWPVTLLMVALAAGLISLLSRKQFLPWFISAGYVIGFLAGVLFRTEGFDPGGGKTDNLWIIWTIVFTACVFLGVIVEAAMKWRRLLKENKRQR